MWGLPLEYHYPPISSRIARVAGEIDQVDRRRQFPGNGRYVRVSVFINPYEPLAAGVMLRTDDGETKWISFYFERIFKICKKCGIIGHSLGRTYDEYENEDCT